MKNIPIAAAKRIAEEYGAHQVLIYARDTETGKEHLTTYGVTKAHCDAMGKVSKVFQRWMGWINDRLTIVVCGPPNAGKTLAADIVRDRFPNADLSPEIIEL